MSASISPVGITPAQMRLLPYTVDISSNYKNIVESNIAPYHNFFYNIYTFTPSSNATTSFVVDASHEIIHTSGFHFNTLKNDNCISAALRQGKLFEHFLLAFVQNFIPKNKNMMDIGANIGIWSIVYSTIINKTIYAFEPQQEIFKCFESNILLNNCANIKSYNIGLSDKRGSAKMNANYTTPNNFGAFRICSSGNLDIQLESGDNLGLTDIGFIKIDVEGHELDAITGLKATILRDKPVIFIEIHKTDPRCNETFQLIVSLGYTRIIKLTHCDCLFLHDSFAL
jgi:FkbM family methyltransferase